MNCTNVGIPAFLFVVSSSIIVGIHTMYFLQLLFMYVVSSLLVRVIHCFFQKDDMQYLIFSSNVVGCLPFY